MSSTERGPRKRPAPGGISGGTRSGCSLAPSPEAALFLEAAPLSALSADRLSFYEKLDSSSNKPRQTRLFTTREAPIDGRVQRLPSWSVGRSNHPVGVALIEPCTVTHATAQASARAAILGIDRFDNICVFSCCCPRSLSEIPNVVFQQRLLGECPEHF